jgi:hypothetical protein
MRAEAQRASGWLGPERRSRLVIDAATARVIAQRKVEREAGN